MMQQSMLFDSAEWWDKMFKVPSVASIFKLFFVPTSKAEYSSEFLHIFLAGSEAVDVRSMDHVTSDESRVQHHVTCFTYIPYSLNTAVKHSDHGHHIAYHTNRFAIDYLIDQSIDPSIHPSIHQSINQSINHRYTCIKLWTPALNVGAVIELKKDFTRRWRSQLLATPDHFWPSHRLWPLGA